MSNFIVSSYKIMMAKSINCFYFSSFTVLANERKTARLLGIAVIIIVIIKTTVVKIVVCIIIFIKFLGLFRSYIIYSVFVSFL